MTDKPLREVAPPVNKTHRAASPGLLPAQHISLRGRPGHGNRSGNRALPPALVMF